MSAEFRGKLRRLVGMHMKLDALVRDCPANGYFKNASGTYSGCDLFESLCDQYRLCIELAPDESERFALQYAYAALLREGMRLNDAAEQCKVMLERRPGKSNVRQLLAFIEARRGNLEEARKLAEVIAADGGGGAFRVSDKDLVREYDARANS